MLETELIKLIHGIKTGSEYPSYLELGDSRKKLELLYASLSAFSNRKGGGVILFGISMGEEVHIEGVSDVEKLKAKVLEQAAQMEPPASILFTEAVIKGETVVSAEVTECSLLSKPCYYKGEGKTKGAYIWDNKKRCKMTECEAYQYEAYRQGIHEDKRVVEAATLSNLNEEALSAYLKLIKLENESLRAFDNERLLNTQGLADCGHPTLAGLLLFGDYPQEFFPQLNILCEKRGGSEEDGCALVAKSKIRHVEGTISQMLERTLKFLSEYAILGDKASDCAQYSLASVRELILNALLHRDYSRYTEQIPIVVTLYEDRLEITSPGALYGRCTIELLGAPMPDTRNVYLMKAAGYALGERVRFHGITAVNTAYEGASRLPVFQDGGGAFKAVISKKYSLDSPYLEMEEKILDYCTVARTREELARHFGIETTSYIVKKYLNPLIEQNRLMLTIPNKPKSKFQKYYRNLSE